MLIKYSYSILKVNAIMSLQLNAFAYLYQNYVPANDLIESKKTPLLM